MPTWQSRSVPPRSRRCSTTSPPPEPGCAAAAATTATRREGSRHLLGGAVDDTQDVRQDAIELEILGRVDGANAGGFQRARILRRDDPADYHRHVAQARGAH